MKRRKSLMQVSGRRICDGVRNENEEKTQNEIGKCILGRCN